jgi:asparagine synthase (glutamine-hydrolysing)
VCGIAGIFSTQSTGAVSGDVLERMNQAQHHRGPDQDGLYFGPGVGLAHKRLSIIDVSEGGRQPFKNSDGTVVAVYNGETYNFLELRKELQQLGFGFRTQCDTEVIVAAWEAWGPRSIDRLRGMFAFAIWDSRSQSLFVGRDRLGKKPLYYTVLPDGEFVFGSELKALLAHPGCPRQLRKDAVEDYFCYGYVPDPKTIFEGVYKLPPAHALLLVRGKPVPDAHAYWDVSFERSAERSEDEVAGELIERLRDAVKVRLMSDVPLGAFLSGGVDSSGVVAMMAGLSKTPVNTCSISFGDPSFNEARFAREVAERYHTNHFVEQVEADDFALIDTLAEVYDEPYADSSAMPTYRVCELARKRVTVALSGDGGDENLAGYRRHRFNVGMERIRTAVPAGIREPLFGALGAGYPKLDWAPKPMRAKSTFQALARDLVGGYQHSVSVVPDHLRARLFSDSFKRALQGYHAMEVFRYHAERAPTDDPLSLLQYLDLKTYLPGDILVKVDRASMAHSLEVRSPFLDHQLVEWMSGLDPDLKLRGHEGKYILKKALEPYLPLDVLYRPKMGFSVPLAAWFRGPLRERVREAVLSPRLEQTGIFDRTFLRTAVDDHQSGMSDHSAMLWSVLMFEAFERKVLHA